MFKRKGSNISTHKKRAKARDFFAKKESSYIRKEWLYRPYVLKMFEDDEVERIVKNPLLDLPSIVNKINDTVYFLEI